MKKIFIILSLCALLPLSACASRQEEEPVELSAKDIYYESVETLVSLGMSQEEISDALQDGIAYGDSLSRHYNGSLFVSYSAGGEAEMFMIASDDAWRICGGIYIGAPESEVFSQLGENEAKNNTYMYYYDSNNEISTEDSGEADGYISITVEDGEVTAIILAVLKNMK